MESLQISKASLEKAWSRILNHKSASAKAHACYTSTNKKPACEPLSSAKRRSRKERIKLTIKPYFTSKEKLMIGSIQEYYQLLAKSATLIQKYWRASRKH